MSKFNRAAIISAFVAGFGLFGMAQNANATLMISVNGNVIASDTTNTYVNYQGVIGSFAINSISAAGVNSFGGSGELFDLSALDISCSRGSDPSCNDRGTITFRVTETNLSAGAASTFSGAFSGLINNANVTRSIYLDTANTGALATLLGTTNGTSGSFGLTTALNGKFSLTEVITITATGSGAKLSSDDSVSVPEPMSLGLLGAGLAGIGFIRRRAKMA